MPLGDQTDCVTISVVARPGSPADLGVDGAERRRPVMRVEVSTIWNHVRHTATASGLRCPPETVPLRRGSEHPSSVGERDHRNHHEQRNDLRNAQGATLESEYNRSRSHDGQGVQEECRGAVADVELSESNGITRKHLGKVAKAHLKAKAEKA